MALTRQSTDAKSVALLVPPLALRRRLPRALCVDGIMRQIKVKILPGMGSADGKWGDR